MPYGQLAARLAGLMSYKAWVLIPCVWYGYWGQQGMTNYDGGKCAGEFVSLLLDVKF
jgi:hypothetical protein